MAQSYQTTLRTTPDDEHQDGSGKVKVYFGGGIMNLHKYRDSSAAEPFLTEGIATYSDDRFEPTIEYNDKGVVITSGHPDRWKEISNFPFTKDYVNEWDLSLGSGPLKFSAVTGAGKISMDFGGLSLTSIKLQLGASETMVDFSEPMLNDLKKFHIDGGAMKLVVTNLCNSRADEIDLNLGAGDFVLDFRGDLTRNLRVSLNGGAARYQILVPGSRYCSITKPGLLVGMSVGENWRVSGENYIHEGDGPKIIIESRIGLGSLELKEIQ